MMSSSTLQSRIAANDQGAGHNSVDCSNIVVEEDSTYTSGLLTGDSASGGQKVLGVSWHPPSDTFEFDVTNIARSLHELEPTKQNIVGVASQFYNPLGFLSPVVITLKIFFQELCKSMDDPLPHVLELKWKGLVSKFHGTVVSVPDVILLPHVDYNPAPYMDSMMLQLLRMLLLFTYVLVQTLYSLWRRKLGCHH